jgi:hypothetical protein
VVDTVAERVRGLKEKVEAIPELLREKAKEGAKDIAMQDIVGPPQTPPSNGGNFPAGSLATNYGPMRTREHLQSPAGTAFGDPHISTVGRIDHELPAAASGSRELVLNGQSRSAAEFPEGHQIMTPAGESWQVTPIAGIKRFVRAGDMVDEAKPVSSITANNRWLDERGKPRDPAAAPTRLVDMKFKPGELERAERSTTSEDLKAQPGLIETSASDLGPGLGTKGRQQAYAIMPDGRIFEIGRDFKLSDDEKNLLAEINPDFGDHAALFARFPDLPGGVVRVTRYEDSIAGDLPSEGLTRQQNARLRNIEAKWKREGLGNKAMFPSADEVKPEIAPNASEGAHQPGSVGAQLSPESLAYQESVLRAQGRLVPTGIGLENMPLNPIMRAFQGASVSAMRFAADVASTGGLITRGNAEGIANLAPVETLFQVNWNKRLVDTLRYQQDEWSAYRHKVAGAADFRPEDVNIEQKPDWKRTGEQIGEALKDRFSPGDHGLSYEQFRIRVAEAQNHGDRDLTNDAASPYVNASAAKFRSDIYDHARKRAQETGVFDEVYQASLDQAHSDINAIEKEIKDMGVRSHVEKWTPDQRRLAEEALMARQEDAEFKYAQQKKQLDALRDHGPLLNGTAESYRPRLWDTGRLIDNEQDFFDKVVPWFQSKAGGALDLTEAVRITKQIHETLSHQNPIFDRGDMKALFQSVAGPTSAHARSFTIPDELVKDFLVNDSETLARYHVQQMGKAIEF